MTKLHQLATEIAQLSNKDLHTLSQVLYAQYPLRSEALDWALRVQYLEQANQQLQGTK